MESIAKGTNLIQRKRKCHSQIAELVMNYSWTTKHSKSLMLFYHQKDFNMKKVQFFLVITYLFHCIGSLSAPGDGYPLKKPSSIKYWGLETIGSRI